MNENKKCPKSSRSANFGGGGNSLRLRNEGLENGTAKPCHPEERSDVGIASSLKNWLTNKRNGLIASSPYSPSPSRGMSEAKVEQESTETLSFRCDCERCRLVRGRIDRQAGKVAFTLAEVLITLGIIGIVAALTLPAFISNVQGRIQAKRVENINQKLSKVTDKMAVQSGLIGYPDTMAFVQEMKKHMSIAKVCDNSHLSECWGTTEVDVGKDKPWEISKTKTAKNLKINSDNWADTVGIVTADGTPMILSYDKNCNFDPNNTGLQYNQSSGKSNSLACLSGVFDWNGGAKPNKLGDDVITLGMASGLGSSCAFEVGSTCYTAPFTPTPMTKAECEAQKSTLGINGCYYDNDYWAGAVKACKDQGKKLPTMTQLAELASQLYVGNPTIGATESKSGIQFDSNSSTAKALGLTPYFYLWSGEEFSSSDAYFRHFDATYLGRGVTLRKFSYLQAVCLGE